MVHIGTSSLASKAYKAKIVVKKSVKSSSKGSRTFAGDIEESSPTISMREQTRPANRSMEPVDPWGNSISTSVATNPEAPQVKRASTEVDSDRVPRRTSSLGPNNNGIIHLKDVGVDSADISSPSPEEIGLQAGEDASEEWAQDQEVDEDNPEASQQPPEIEDQVDYRQKLAEAQEVESQLLSRVTQLEAQLQQQRQRCIELDRAWKKSTTLLTQLQKQDPHEKVDDASLQGLYNELVFDVSNWAASFCRGGAMRIIDAKRPLLQSLGPAYSAYYHDETLRPFLLQSLLMRLLVREVLNFDCDGGLWWAGSLCKALRRVQTELNPADLLADPESIEPSQIAEMREYARWKAKGALLIGKKADRLAVETGINRVVSKFKSELYIYVPASNADVWPELREIVAKAVRLDEEMNKSRALLTVSHWQAEDLDWMKFNENCMESAVGFPAARAGMSLELVLAPALIKVGTADGEAYDKISFLSKWTVICRESRENKH
ncbi:Nn.00g029400.m01.CDS01 [Neocucurbitaria sp. VM-36]